MPSTLAGETSMLTWRCRPSCSASRLALCSRSFSARQGEIKEVAAAAGGVEHFEILEAFEIGDECALRFLQGIFRTFAAFFVERHALGNEPFAVCHCAVSGSTITGLMMRRMDCASV